MVFAPLPQAIVGCFSVSAQRASCSSRSGFGLVESGPPLETKPYSDDQHLGDIRTLPNIKFRPMPLPENKPVPVVPPATPKPPKDDDDQFLYRFDTRSPSEIAKKGGFKAWGLNFSIRDHVTGKSIKNKTSAYVSTSKTRKGALDLWKGRKDGYLYKIKRQLTGIDVSPISPYPHQQEVAVPLYISPSDIINSERLLQIRK